MYKRNFFALNKLIISAFSSEKKDIVPVVLIRVSILSNFCKKITWWEIYYKFWPDWCCWQSETTMAFIFTRDPGEYEFFGVSNFIIMLVGYKLNMYGFTLTKTGRVMVLTYLLKISQKL